MVYFSLFGVGQSAHSIQFCGSPLCTPVSFVSFCVAFLPVWGRYIAFSFLFSKFFRLVLLLSALSSPSCLFV